jgi:hypothetical protein
VDSRNPDRLVVEAGPTVSTFRQRVKAIHTLIIAPHVSGNYCTNLGHVETVYQQHGFEICPVSRSVKKHFENGKINAAQKGDRGTAKRFPPNSPGDFVVKVGRIEKQIQWRRIPPDANLSISLEYGHVLFANTDTFGHGIKDPLEACNGHKYIDVDVDRTACALGAPRKRQCTAERVWQVRAPQRYMNSDDLFDQVRHGGKLDSPFVWPRALETVQRDSVRLQVRPRAPVAGDDARVSR